MLFGHVSLYNPLFCRGRDNVTGDALHHLSGRVELRWRTGVAQASFDSHLRCVSDSLTGSDLCNGKRKTDF